MMGCLPTDAILPNAPRDDIDVFDCFVSSLEAKADHSRRSFAVLPSGPIRQVSARPSERFAT